MGRGNADNCWIAIFLLLSAATARVSSAAKIYSVGDDAGWIVAANYSAWASSKTFNVGDILVFNYNKTFHNVLEVSKVDYRSCNAASAIATHATGNDSIPISGYGHRFFICGFPGHCAGGQKIDIRIPKHLSAPTPSASSPSATGSSPSVSAPGLALAPHGGGATENVRGFSITIATAANAALALALMV